MNGPEHYQEAESLLERAAEADTYECVRLTAEAQVHATLALAAATAINTLSSPQYHAWLQAANR